MPQLSKMDGPTGLVGPRGPGSPLRFGQWIMQPPARGALGGLAFVTLNPGRGYAGSTGPDVDLTLSSDTANAAYRCEAVEDGEKGRMSS